MKTKLIFFAFSLLFLTLIQETAFTQSTLITAIGSTTATPGQHLNIPITVTNFTNVGSASLTLLYNPSVLTYTGDSGRNPALSVGLFQINSPVPGKIIIAWFSMSPATIAGNGILDEFKFTFISGASNLVWDTLIYGNCEYSDSIGNIIPAGFVPGTVNGGVPANCSNTITYTTTGYTASFSGVAANGAPPYSYLWYFGDGGTSTQQNPTHTYSSNGTYNVTLSTTDANSCFAISNTYITFYQVPPPTGTVGITIGSSTATPGQHLYIPIVANNFTAVSSMALSLLYDTTVLTYTGDTLCNASLGSTNYMISGYIPGKVQIAWFSMTPVTLPANTILDKIKFKYAGGMTNLTWDTLMTGACELSDLNGNLLPAIFYSGSVTAAAPATYTISGNILAGANPLDTGQVKLYLWNQGAASFMPYDSINAGPSGAYSFSSLPQGEYIVKAIPASTSAYYATYLPTYYGNTPYWTSADTISTSMLNNPHVINLVHIIGPMPGAGSIAGTVTNGAKVFSTGTPAVGVEVLLTNLSDQVLAVSYSNSSGHFSFPNLAYGTYKVRAEVTLILSTPVSITLSAGNPSVNNIGFHITPSGITTGLIHTPTSTPFAISRLYPNPVREILYMDISCDKETSIIAEMYNLLGQKVLIQNYRLSNGINTIEINTSDLESGIYTIRLNKPDGKSLLQKFCISK